jgi:hypothetical protein
MGKSSKDDLLAFDPDRPVTLPGRRCAYCGCDLQRRTTTRDHVVARKFVPEGTLATGFHLQVKACHSCNGKKAQLEDDISLITMLPNTAGKLVRDDERLTKTVARKARGAVSPATRRLAAESYNRVKASYRLGGGVSLTYEGLAMPTLDDQRVARLAFYHVQGFCHFRSFDSARGHGRWLEPANFLMLGQLTEADWGNPRLRYFTNETARWERVCLTVLADGYFRHAMFKRPGAELWAWALEWNARLRIFGLYGDEGERAAFESSLPTVPLALMVGDQVNGFALRVDTPLNDDEDVLFAVPDGYEERPYANPHWRKGNPTVC